MIFISYRKEDSADLALALADKLSDAFGNDAVFLDRKRIELGTRWRQEIDNALADSRVVLSLIGQRWLATYDEFGQRRIDRDDDVLGYELSTAIARGLCVIPLYLHGVRPLPAEAFPARLQRLAETQGLPFDLFGDLEPLLRRIEAVTGVCGSRPQGPRTRNASASLAADRPWHMPDSIGGLFKGRLDAVKGLYDRLHERALTPSDTAVRRQIICGLGGIGKTRLAIEYAWTFRNSYQAVLFVVADTPGQFCRSVSDLVDESVLDLPEKTCPEEKTRMGAVIRWLCEHPGWLLIIDNADEQSSIEAVEKVLPRLHGGHVVITSRNSRWNKSFRRTELDVLPAEAAAEFLLSRTEEERHRTDLDAALAAELASELGYLALALEQAGAYIQCRDGGVSLADYLTRWREGQAQVRAYCDKRLMHYERSVAATWETTVRALDPPAITMFNILAWYAANPIPRQMLLATGVADIIRNAMASPPPSGECVDAEEALGQLISYSMTKKTDEQGVACVALHRLVLQISRERMSEVVKGPTVAAAADLLVQYAPKESFRPETWHEWRLLVPHAEAVWGAMQTFSPAFWNIELMKLLALYYLGQGRNDEAVPLQRQVLAQLQQRQVPDDPEMFLAKNDLALMLGLAAADEKETLYREALAGRVGSFGDSSEEVAETMFNYGNFLSLHGRKSEAEPLLQRAHDVFAKLCGPNHWRTLMAKDGLATLLTSRGEYALAEPLHRHAVKGSEESLGIAHADTFRNAANLCMLLEHTDRKEEAAALYLRYLTARGAAPDATALERRQIAGTCMEMGAYDHCESLLIGVLSVGFEVPGTHCHLARVCLLTGRTAEARCHAEQAWKYRGEASAYVVPRALWFQLLFACLENRRADVSTLLGRLRTALGRDGACMEWNMRNVLEELGRGVAGQLETEDLRMLTSLVAAFDDVSKIAALDEFAVWRNANATSLD